MDTDTMLCMRFRTRFNLTTREAANFLGVWPLTWEDWEAGRPIQARERRHLRFLLMADPRGVEALIRLEAQ